jgi:energy-coupling factor transporter ATP-binding protein EcfA2
MCIARMMLTAKENPFAAHRIEALSFQFLHGDWELRLRRLEKLDWRASIVGPKGSGKTTLLLELKQKLHDAGEISDSLTQVHYCFVGRTERDRLAQAVEINSAIEQNLMLLIDGIERFTWRQRRNILRNKSSKMVVTAHRPVGLPVWLHNRTSPELAQTLLRHLIDNPEPWIVDQCDSLFQKHRGNIRDVFRSLYDEMAN